MRVQAKRHGAYCKQHHEGRYPVFPRNLAHFPGERLVPLEAERLPFLAPTSGKIGRE